MDTVTAERAAQDAFLDRADLAQRAVAAAVGDRRAGFEAMHADRVDREVDDHAGALGEDSRAPELRADRETPLGRQEARFERTQLEDADRGRHAVGHDREAGIVAGLALTVRPHDEALETLD